MLIYSSYAISFFMNAFVVQYYFMLYGFLSFDLHLYYSLANSEKQKCKKKLFFKFYYFALGLVNISIMLCHVKICNVSLTVLKCKSTKLICMNHKILIDDLHSFH